MRNVSRYVLLFAFIGFVPFARGAENAPAGYLVFVSNERSGDVSVIGPRRGHEIVRWALLADESPLAI